MTTFKDPPTFKGKDYSQWKSEVELWQMFTEMDKARQGISLALSLEGKAREIAISRDKSLLTTKDGVKNVLAELDKLLEKEKTYHMYEAYTKYKTFKKKCTNLKIDTDALLTLKILYNANLMNIKNNWLKQHAAK